MEGHPFKLQRAVLVAGRLEFRYAAEGAIQVRAARLLGPAGALSVQPSQPDLLTCAIPQGGGRLILSVDDAAPLPEGCPPLPWEVPLFLPDVAVSDYHEAHPCGAVLSLPFGRSLLVDRVLRRTGRTLVYTDWRAGGQGRNRPIPFGASLRAGTQSYPSDNLPYQHHGPDLPVNVQVECFRGVPLDQPLTLVMHHMSIHVPCEWTTELSVPPERPLALRVDQAITVPGLSVTLEEVWLGLGRTVLAFRSGSGAQPEPITLSLADGTGQQYPATWSNSRPVETACAFEPVPPGVDRLVIRCTGMTLQMNDQVELPLGTGVRATAQPRTTARPMYTTSDWFPVIMPAAAPRPTRSAPAASRDQLRAWMEQQQGPARRVQFARAPLEALNPREGHVGGPPFLPAGQTWPTCGHCQKPLTFIGQMPVAGLPGAELLTFYYCLACRPGGPEGAAAYHLALHGGVSQGPLQNPAPESRSGGPVPCRVTLTEAVSVPHWEDARSDVAHLDLGSDPWEAYRDVWDALTNAPTLETRLGGYPDWISGAEWPACPDCGRRMTLLWQLDSEPETGLMWGDSGRLFLFACPGPCHDRALALVLQSC